MKDLKDSLRADAIGNLYRVATFLAKGEIDLASIFLKKSAQILSSDELGELAEVVNKPLNDLSKEERLLWAEKSLDRYKYLLRSL